VDEPDDLAAIGDVPAGGGPRPRRRADVHGDPAETLDGRETFFVSVSGADVDRQGGAQAREEPQRCASEGSPLRGRLDRVVPAAQPQAFRRGEPAEVFSRGDLVGGGGLTPTACSASCRSGSVTSRSPKFCTSAPCTPT
jgi:hypothetical protein